MVFFFKQKTAYEMRISDWSSDVCSSDLEFAILLEFQAFDRVLADVDVEAAACGGAGFGGGSAPTPGVLQDEVEPLLQGGGGGQFGGDSVSRSGQCHVCGLGAVCMDCKRVCSRSEERRVGKESGSKG